MSSVFGKLCGSDKNTTTNTNTEAAAASQNLTGKEATAGVYHGSTASMATGTGLDGGMNLAAPASSYPINTTNTSSSMTSTTTTSNNFNNNSNFDNNNLNRGTASSFQGSTVDSKVAAPIQLPTQYLPTVHKTEQAPTEVRREERHHTTEVLQPVRRDVVQPVETTVQKNVVKEIQPIEHTRIQPQVETVVHQQPKEIRQNIHETNKLETVNQAIQKPPVVLPTKVGDTLPGGTQVKDITGMNTTTTTSQSKVDTFSNKNLDKSTTGHRHTTNTGY